MTTPILPNSIEAAILYDSLPRFTAAEVRDHLGSVFEHADFKIAEKFGPESFLLQGSGGLFVLVSRNDRPLAPEGFESALASTATRLTFGEATDLVRRHRTNVFVTVSSGLPMPETLRGSGPDPRGQDPKEFAAKSTICRVLTAWIMRRSKPRLVHWLQSNQIFRPAVFIEFAVAQNPTPLFVQPRFFSPEEPDGTRRRFGIVTFGAVHLVGREVQFEPAELPMDYVWNRTIAFIDHVRQAREGALIPDGESFGSETGEVIRVRHLAPAPGDASGAISLTLESRGQGARDVPSPCPDVPTPAHTDAADSAGRSLFNVLVSWCGRVQVAPAPATTPGRVGVTGRLFGRRA